MPIHPSVFRHMTDIGYGDYHFPKVVGNIDILGIEAHSLQTSNAQKHEKSADYPGDQELNPWIIGSAVPRCT
jgi:hypothetical protein